MKKIITFVVCCLLCVVKVSALENDSHVDVTYNDYIFSNRQIGDNFYDGQQGIIYVNGKIAYCLDPTIFLNNDSYSSSGDFSIIGIRDEQLAYLEIVSYFGYGYNGRYDSKYYYATQEIIWEYLTGGEIYWTSSRGGSVVNIDSYKNEILTSVNHYLMEPDIPKYSETYVGTDIILEDKNNVLQYYNTDIWLGTIEDNKLTLSAEFRGTVTLNLIKQPLNYETSYVYVSNDSQSLATFGYSSHQTNTIEVKYKVRALTKLRLVNKELGSDKIIKNKETKIKIFDVQNNKYIEENGTNIFTIGADGIIETMNYIEEGEYYIEEVQAPSGYKEQNKLQIFNIYEYHGPMTEITIYHEPIVHSLYIDVQGEMYQGFEEGNRGIYGIYSLEDMNSVQYGLYAEENIYNVEGNILYPKDTLVTTIDITNGFGSAIEIVHGKYYLKELSCPKDYIISKDITKIDFTSNEESINIKFIKSLKKGTIIIHKVENQIGLKGARFILENKKYSYSITLESDAFGYIMIEDIPYDTYTLKEIKSPLGYQLDTIAKELLLDTSELHYDFVNQKIENEKEEEVELPIEEENKDPDDSKGEIEEPNETEKEEEVEPPKEEENKDLDDSKGEIEEPNETKKEEEVEPPKEEEVEPPKEEENKDPDDSKGEIEEPNETEKEEEVEPPIEEENKESNESEDKIEEPSEKEKEEEVEPPIEEENKDQNEQEEQMKFNTNVENIVPNPKTGVSLVHKSFFEHIILCISLVLGILNIKMKL